MNPTTKSVTSAQRIDFRLTTDNQAEKFAAHPPIRKVAFWEVEQTLKTLQDNMEGWDNVALPATKLERKENLDTEDWASPKRTVQARWNNKLDDTREILTKIQNEVCERKEYYAYEVDGTPIGTMVLDVNFINPDLGNDYLFIDFLMMHPGSGGGGGSLIEIAVKRSLELGKHGNLLLSTFNAESSKAYQAMGFNPYPWCQETQTFQVTRDYPGVYHVGCMLLEPFTSTSWKEDDNGEWKLSKHIHKKYMQTAFSYDEAS